MAYVKQNFVDGNVLHASELNHMEDGIGDAYVKPSGGIPGTDIADSTITAAKIAANAVSTIYTATIDADDWVGGVNEVTVNGILATDRPIIDVDMTDVVDMSAVQDAFGAVLKITTSANKLTVYADDAPSVDIPIKILCIRK